MADERGADGKFLPGNQASAGRTEPIVPTNWEPPHSRGPARGYSWPQFQPGHVSLTQTHGAMTERIRAPLERAIVEELLELAAAPDSPVGYLAEPAYRGALRIYARAQVQAQLMADYLEEHGQFDEEGRLRQAVDARRRLDEQALNAGSRLGLDPVSRAKLLSLLGEARRDAAAAEAHAELQQRYGKPVVVEGDGP